MFILHVTKGSDVIINWKRSIVIIIFVVVQFSGLFECKPQLVRIICCRRRSNRWGWCSLCTRRSISLSLYFSSLTTTMQLFSSLSVYTLVHLARTYTSRRQWRATAGFSSLILFIRQEKSREETKEKREEERWWTTFFSFSIGQMYYKFFLLTDTQRPIKFH